MEKLQGKVISYFEDKGYGFILDEKGNKRFFHVSDAVKPLEIQSKIMVEFEPSENAKGLSAKNVSIVQSNTGSKFIKVFEKNIKCSNIKDFGIAEDIKILYKRKKDLLDNVFGTNNEKLYHYNELPESDLPPYFIDTSSFKEVQKKYFYLYITTYQGDNYTWEKDLKELETTLKYIENNI